MILLALDASTTAVGWSLFGGADYVDSGVYRPKGDDWVSRVCDIERWLYDVDVEADYDTIGYEIATGNRGNMATHRKLGAVEFVVRQYCKFTDIDLHTVTASQVKATGCHKNAPWAATTIKRSQQPDGYLDEKHPGDEADAIGVALAVIRKAREAEYG